MEWNGTALQHNSIMLLDVSILSSLGRDFGYLLECGLCKKCLKRVSRLSWSHLDLGGKPDLLLYSPCYLKKVQLVYTMPVSVFCRGQFFNCCPEPQGLQPWS